MKQNWWKLLVVVVLVAAVGVVLAAKSKTRESGTKIIAKSSVNTSSESAPKPEVAVAPKETPKVVAENVKSTQPDETPKVDAGKLATKDVAPKAKQQPIKQAVVKKEEPKQKPEAKIPQAEQVSTKLPKFLELGANKCIPCKMMKPIVDELEKKYKGKLEVEFIDVWQNEGVAEKYGIQSIPTQIFFDSNGKEFFRHQGFFAKEDILKTFKDHNIKL
ncbi:MAG: thioredoxin domain-containing protein [Armatimonadota bacterium]|nr:thioredoxin fold domain-containing protein [bacterium]